MKQLLCAFLVAKVILCTSVDVTFPYLDTGAPEIHMDFPQLYLSFSSLQIRLHAISISRKENCYLIHLLTCSLTHSFNTHLLRTYHLPDLGQCWRQRGIRCRHHSRGAVSQPGQRSPAATRVRGRGSALMEVCGGVIGRQRITEFFLGVLGKATIMTGKSDHEGRS